MIFNFDLLGNGQAVYFISPELHESMAGGFDASADVFSDPSIHATPLTNSQLASPEAILPGTAISSALQVKKKNQKKAYYFEINPTIRRRQQTRLLRKLQATLAEYSSRVGQQAVLLTCAPSKNNLFNFKVIGSHPLDDVMRGQKERILSDLNECLAVEVMRRRKMVVGGDKHELPPINVDGIPTPIDKMTQAQLRMFIPEMMRYSTLRSKPGWSKEEFRPPWWPEDVPWANVRCDIRSDAEKARQSWTHVLRKIILNCYLHHHRADLLPSYSKNHLESGYGNDATIGGYGDDPGVGGGLGNDVGGYGNDVGGYGNEVRGIVIKKEIDDKTIVQTDNNDFIYLIDPQQQPQQQVVIVQQPPQQLTTTSSTHEQQIIIHLENNSQQVYNHPQQIPHTSHEIIHDSLQHVVQQNLQQPQQLQQQPAWLNDCELFLVQLDPSSNSLDSSFLQPANETVVMETSNNSVYEPVVNINDNHDNNDGYRVVQLIDAEQSGVRMEVVEETQQLQHAQDQQPLHHQQHIQLHEQQLHVQQQQHIQQGMPQEHLQVIEEYERQQLKPLQYFRSQQIQQQDIQKQHWLQEDLQNLHQQPQLQQQSQQTQFKFLLNDNNNVNNVACEEMIVLSNDDNNTIHNNGHKENSKMINNNNNNKVKSIITIKNNNNNSRKQWKSIKRLPGKLHEWTNYNSLSQPKTQNSVIRLNDSLSYLSKSAGCPVPHQPQQILLTAKSARTTLPEYDAFKLFTSSSFKSQLSSSLSSSSSSLLKSLSSSTSSSSLLKSQTSLLSVLSSSLSSSSSFLKTPSSLISILSSSSSSSSLISSSLSSSIISKPIVISKFVKPTIPFCKINFIRKQ